MSYLRLTDAAAHLDGLNAMGIIGPQDSRGQIAVLNHQKQGKTMQKHSYCKWVADKVMSIMA